jgi:hypothetical protein
MPIFRRWMEQLKQVGAVSGGTGSWGNYAATIASDAISIGDPGIYAITGEGGLADNLATINGGNTGDELVLYAADTTKTITVKHGTGNIHIGADFSLDDEYDMIRLLKRSSGKWTGGGLADNG